MSVERVKRMGGEVVYRVRWREGGRNRARTFSKKRDAEVFEAQIKQRRRLGTLTQLDAGREALNDYVTETWAPTHTANLSARTRKVYAALYDHHIAPALGDLPLREITPESIARWQADALTAGAGKSSIHKALTLLGGILQRAAEAQRIPSNPARYVRKVRVPRAPEVRPLSLATIEHMRASVSDRDAALLAVLAYAGLRPGEALSLLWGHVRERTLTVNASKTGQRRSVRLLAPLAADLAAWRLACGRPGDDVPVFPGHDGGTWTEAAYQSWRRRTFRKAAVAAGAEGARPYDLRHTFCSLLLAEGGSVIEVARQLGHAATLTLSTYGHVMDELVGAERVSTEAAIRRAREARVPVSYPRATHTRRAIEAASA